MLKKTIKYKDFNDEEVEEDFFFHLSKAELIELQMSHSDGLAEAMERMINANDTKSLVEEFKKIILMSYGRKSLDGKRFVKTQTIRDEFESSEAYSTLFFELATNTDAAIEFMNGIIPPNLGAEMEAIQRREKIKPVPEVKEPQRLTMKELREMNIVGHELTDKIISGEIVVVDE
jgi:hypothetical protein